MQGWIKLHRCLKEKAIWQNSSPEHKTILITLLMMANHEEKQWEWNGGKFVVKPGQFVTSLESIRKKAGKGISIKNIRSALKRFEKLEFLANETAKAGRLITIVNWGVYQGEEKKGAKQKANRGQTGGKQGATNKNDKNDKNEKNDKKVLYAEFVKMTSAEYQKLRERFGEQTTVELINILDNYKGSTGKKYESDYRAILSWVVKRYEEDRAKGKKPQNNEPQAWETIRQWAEDKEARERNGL